MLYPQDIVDRLKELVEEKFPGEPVFLDPLPQKFERPSSYIALQKFTGDAGFAPHLVEFSPVVKLVTFPERDDYGNCPQREVNRRQMLLTAIVMPGYVKVGDRAPKVAKLELEGGDDFASVTATFQYAVSREEFLKLEEEPVMEEIRFREIVSNSDTIADVSEWNTSASPVTVVGGDKTIGEETPARTWTPNPYKITMKQRKE